MAYSYTQLQDIKNRIVRDLASQQERTQQAVAVPTAIKNDLTAMQSTYGTWATEVNAYVTANPGDAAAIALKAERDIIVAEFATAKTRATAIETAVTGL